MWNHVDYMLYQTELYIKYESNMIVSVYVTFHQQKMTYTNNNRNATLFPIINWLHIVDYTWMLDCIQIMLYIKSYCYYLRLNSIVLNLHMFSYIIMQCHMINVILLLWHRPYWKNDNLTYDSILCYIKIKYNIIPLYIYIHIVLCYFVLICLTLQCILETYVYIYYWYYIYSLLAYNI